MPDSTTLPKATRRLCEHGGGDARPAATVKNGETKEKSIKSQNLETQIEDHKPLQGTEGKKTGESDSHVLKHESSVKEKAAAEKQDKKTSSHKKLHDLSSLASTDSTFLWSLKCSRHVPKLGRRPKLQEKANYPRYQSLTLVRTVLVPSLLT
ncbi:uncharacterized protein LOC135101168 isoform X2 [Scylla paramamosain]|uniref:uncharacterized protein LOC135101168 isoform X2 n=1 Tax=Scylla paramamosain TaxID=85552 RepID=UPI003082918F